MAFLGATAYSQTVVANAEKKIKLMI